MSSTATPTPRSSSFEVTASSLRSCSTIASSVISTINPDRSRTVASSLFNGPKLSRSTSSRAAGLDGSSEDSSSWNAARESAPVSESWSAS
jgi:hypothetical protein